MSNVPPPPSGAEFDKMVERLNMINREERASVLIFHLYIEYYLDWFIRKQLADPERVLKWTFGKKLELIESFKILPIELLKNVKRLDSIRNLYAHNIDTESSRIQTQMREQLKLFDWYGESKQNEKMENFALYSYFATLLYHKLHFAYAELYGAYYPNNP